MHGRSSFQIKMNSMNVIVLFLLTLCTSSLQKPTFFKSTFKGLRGISPEVNLVVSRDIRVVYYHDQTVAIADLGANNELHDCNLIEVYEPEEAELVLRNLSMTVSPQKVSFEQMIRLMQQCETLDKLQFQNLMSIATNTQDKKSYSRLSTLTLLSGIVPGTKWCGTGDIAENYHDLGQEANIDRCCRNHDLCPVKVRAQKSRYNLNNNSLYTKSHCTCDEIFYNCLKTAESSVGNFMGNIYFNIIKVPCIDDVSSQWFMESEKEFVPTKMKY